MRKNSELQQKYENARLIDFLEDQEFRKWVFNPDEGINDDARVWEAVVQVNREARKAKYILVALKRHFDQNQLTRDEIESQLNLEIDKYRTGSRVGKIKYLSINWMTRIAVVAVVLVGLFFLVKWMNRPYEVYQTGYGERLTIQLPDESVIQMNSNSRLIWNRGWETTGKRVVELEGEAFFEIKRKDEIPFLVNTDDITIQVTGTQFNVNSRRQRTMVYLDEGKVNVAVKKRPDKKFEMVPGEELIYIASRDKVEQKMIDEPELVSGWMAGFLVFREQPLMKVLESVSDIYGKKFVTKDSALLHRNITTTIPLTNWEVTLTAIQLAMRLEVYEMKDSVKINSVSR